MLSFSYCYAERHYAECRFAECRGAATVAPNDNIFATFLSQIRTHHLRIFNRMFYHCATNADILTMEKF